MAQKLLEKQYNCLFYEKADKKMQAPIIDRDKHVGGIDVTGIRNYSDGFKFVVCEVKASSSKDIPCSSAKDLLDDINKSFYDESERTTKEVMNYLSSLSNVLKDDNDQIIYNIVKFLMEIIEEKGKESLGENRGKLKGNRKGRPRKIMTDKERIKYLEIENAYLKEILKERENILKKKK